MAVKYSMFDEIGPIMFGEVEKVIDHLQKNKLLASTRTCTCGSRMVLGKRIDVSDGVRFRCPNCHSCKSLRDGSFFSKSRLPLNKWFLVIYWWARKYALKDAADEAGITTVSVCAIYQWLREVCSSKLLQSPVRLGGPGKIVQIDESLMRHKPKVQYGNNIM